MQGALGLQVDSSNRADVVMPFGPRAQTIRICYIFTITRRFQ
jgi:hypothetical protein